MGPRVAGFLAHPPEDPSNKPTHKSRAVQPRSPTSSLAGTLGNPKPVSRRRLSCTSMIDEVQISAASSCGRCIANEEALYEPWWKLLATAGASQDPCVVA